MARAALSRPVKRLIVCGRRIEELTCSSITGNGETKLAEGIVEIADIGVDCPSMAGSGLLAGKIEVEIVPKGDGISDVIRRSRGN
jgi:hypothetical protein